MPRKEFISKKSRLPDPLFESQLIAKLINHVMLDGKKSTAQRIVYRSLNLFYYKFRDRDSNYAEKQTIYTSLRVRSFVLELFEEMLNQAKPHVELKSVRIGGAAYSVPHPVSAERQITLALRWLISHARKYIGKSMEDALFLEMSDVLNGVGKTMKRLHDLQKMAQANQVFSHYKWK